MESHTELKFQFHSRLFSWGKWGAHCKDAHIKRGDAVCLSVLLRGLEAAAACGQLRNDYQKHPLEGFSATS
jgi:hypothetical protein